MHKPLQVLAIFLSAVLISGCNQPPEGEGEKPGGPPQMGQVDQKGQGGGKGKEGGGGKPSGPPPIGVVIQPAVMLKDSQELELFGNVRSPDRLTVFSRTSGQIKQLPAREGDRVSVGQVVAVLDGEDQKLAVRLAKEQVEEQEARIYRMKLGERKDIVDQILARRKAQEANLKLAQDEIARLEPLVIKGYAPQQDLIGAELARDRVQAQIDELNAQIAEANQGERKEDIASQLVQLKIRKTELEKAKLNLERTTVRSPLAGVVQTRMASIGQLVNVGAPLLDLVPTQGLDLELLLPENFSGRVKIGDGLMVSFPALGRGIFSGKVAGMSPATESGSRNQRLRVKLVGKQPNGLIPGMEARGILRLGTSTVGIGISRDALVLISGKETIFTVKDDKAVPVPVKIKLDMGTQLLVSGGIMEGDPVVILGNEQLKDGSPVTIVREAGAARLIAPPKQREN